MGLFSFFKSKSTSSIGVDNAQKSPIDEQESLNVASDNVLTEECKVITSSGATIFKVQSIDDLIFKNRLLIEELQLHLKFFEEDFIRVVNPLIIKLARICSIAPASQALHDHERGGLFKHSLFVAVKSLETLETSHVFDKFQLSPSEHQFLKLSFVVIAFVHDLAKLDTDLRISTLGDKYTFNYKNEIFLDDFIKKHQATALKVRFVPGRHQVHNSKFFTSLKLFFKDSKAFIDVLTQNPKLKPLWYNFLKGDAKSLFLKHLRVADIYACKASINTYNSMYEIGNYLKNLFYTQTIDLSLPGFYKLKGGYFIEHCSEAYKTILEHFDNYFILLDEVKEFKPNTRLSFKHYCLTSEQLKDEDANSNVYHDYDHHYIGLNKSITNREPFFRALTNTNFLIISAYKMSCAYRAILKDGVVTIVYGFVIKLDDECDVNELGFDIKVQPITERPQSNSDIPDMSLYCIVGEYFDADLKKVITYLEKKFINAEKKKGYRITSFKLKSQISKIEFNQSLDDLETAISLIDLDSVVVSDFSLERELDSKDRTKIKQRLKREHQRELKQQMAENDLYQEQLAKSLNEDDMDFY